MSRKLIIGDFPTHARDFAKYFEKSFQGVLSILTKWSMIPLLNRMRC
jgi:hypothetical protein